MSESLSFAHVTVAVSDLNRSVPWNGRVFDTELSLDLSPGPFRRAVLLVGGHTVVGLHQFPDAADAGPFDERRVGLDHLAFAGRDRRELEAWELRRDGLGIAHGGIVDAAYGSGLSFRHPDNIALEFFAPRAQ